MLRTSPAACASSTENTRPLYVHSSAVLSPTTFGRNHDEHASGTRPRRANTNPIFAFVEAKRLIDLGEADVVITGAALGDRRLMAVARPVAMGQFGFLLISFLCLIWAFVYNDFSVVYVEQNSNSQLPVWYRVSAVWGGHEGSLLLWVLILAGWTMAVAVFSGHLPRELLARCLKVEDQLGHIPVHGCLPEPFDLLGQPLPIHLPGLGQLQLFILRVWTFRHC